MQLGIFAKSMGRTSLPAICMAAAAWLAGCQQPDSAAPPLSAGAVTPTNHDSQTSLEMYVRELVARYETWPQVTPTIRWSPDNCAAPFQPYQPRERLRASGSQDESTHGRKLYFLHARYPKGYRSVEPAVAPGGYLASSAEEPAVVTPVRPGQTIVKRTWHAVPVSDNRSGPTAALSGVYYQRGEPGDLFVMTKLDKNSALRRHSDDGWIYAVLSDDRQTVRAAGKIENCMECHAAAPHERLFGLRPADAARDRSP